MIGKKTVIATFLLCFFLDTIYSQSNNKSIEEDILAIKKKGYSFDACLRMADDNLKSQSDQRKAIPYLEYIYQNDKKFKPKVCYMLSQAYYYDGRFDKAISFINEYIEKEKDGQMLKQAKTELERYKNAERVASSPLNAILINLGPEINGKNSEINPFISKDENLLVYSSNRTKNFDIYVSKKGVMETSWSQPKLAGNMVNSVNDEFVAGLSSSGKKLMVHYNQVSGFEDINISTREKGLYRELEDPGTKINSSYKEEGACISESGDTIYFASDRPGGFGGFDLYYSLRLPDGTYGIPINLGEIVNTKFDENYPNLSPDGAKLYFASKGHNSIGGYDIFSTSLDASSQQWTKPMNLGYPINNAYDNKNITFSNYPRYAYISTIYDDSYGDFDIYKVIFMDIEPGYIIVKAEVFVDDGLTEVPYTQQDQSLEITAYQNEVVFGKYTFDKRNNSFVLAFKPGIYILEIEAEGFESYRKKITIDENYYLYNQRSLKVVLKKKKSD